MDTDVVVPASTPRKRPARFRGVNSGLVIGGGITALMVIAALCAPWLTPHHPEDGNLMARLQRPSIAHPLGTDALGRDLLSRLIYGTRVSLIVGLSGVAVAMVIGVPLGIGAALAGGRWDDLLMRGMDVLLAVPKILIAILIMAVLGAGIGNLVFAIGLWNIPVFARIARANALSLRERDFVTAAIAVGASRLRIMMRHILPNTAGDLVVIASLAVATAIMAESGLSFLGLGVPPHIPSWGMIISEGRSYLRNAPHVVGFAGLFIMISVLGFNLLGDGIRDRIDPHGSRSGRGV